MSAPRTMSEEQEAGHRIVSRRRMSGVGPKFREMQSAALNAFAELDAERAAYAALERDLAAAQAEVVEAHGIIQWMSGSESFGPGGEAHEGWVKSREVLFRSPGSLSALEAMLTKAVDEAWWGKGYSDEAGENSSALRAAIVSRILGKEAARG